MIAVPLAAEPLSAPPVPEGSFLCPAMGSVLRAQAVANGPSAAQEGGLMIVVSSPGISGRPDLSSQPDLSPGEGPLSPAPAPLPWSVDPLQGWHLPLLDDAAVLPLQPLVQRAVLLEWPERLLAALVRRPPLAAQVLVALQRESRSRQRALGLIASRRINRSGSCWQLVHLTATALASTVWAPGRAAVTTALLRAALERGREATSWIAFANPCDRDLLACLREQGFQPQRTEGLWRWPVPSSVGAAGPALPPAYELRALNRRTAPLLWHLEQAACPAPLRQLLDRRPEDLLDQSQGRGWMLVDPTRNQAVVAVRWLADHSEGGAEVELTLHPGWSHLLGPATELLLRRLASSVGGPLWLHCQQEDQARQTWLHSQGAEAREERVLMARSIWRRQTWRPSQRAGRRLDAVLEQFQPRRRPLPSPLARG